MFLALHLSMPSSHLGSRCPSLSTSPPLLVMLSHLGQVDQQIGGHHLFYGSLGHCCTLFEINTSILTQLLPNLLKVCGIAGRAYGEKILLQARCWCLVVLKCLILGPLLPPVAPLVELVLSSSAALDLWDVGIFCSPSIISVACSHPQQVSPFYNIM